MSENRNRTAFTPPVVGVTTWSLDASDINPTTYIAVPDEWKEAVLEFHADGEDFCFVFGDSSLTGVTATNSSTISSNAITAQGSTCYRLADNERVVVDLRRVDAKYKARFAALGVTGTANNELRVTRVDGYAR